MEATPEFMLLESIPHNVTVGIASTVDKLVELTAAAAQQSQGEDPRALEDHIWQLWTALLELAARTPAEEQKKLVALVSQLQRRAVPDPATGQQLRHQDGAIWSDLPTLGWVVRDAWNFSVLDPNASARDLTRWERQTAFLAQLTALPAAKDAAHLDFSLYALWAFRDAFETSTDQASAAAVRSASIWFIYAADKLLLNVREGRAFEGKLAAPGDRASGKDWSGFNKDRWELWLEGLAAARPAGDSSVGLVAAAKEAIENATAKSA